MSEPWNRPVERRADESIYTHRLTNLNGLLDFVIALYVVGANGDERIQTDRGWEIKVPVASNDLMPSPGHGPVQLRHAEYQRLVKQIHVWRAATATLAVSFVVFLIVLWVTS